MSILVVYLYDKKATKLLETLGNMKTFKNIHGRINQRANQRNFLIQQYSSGLSENINERAKRLSLFANSFDVVDEEPMYSDLKLYHYGSNSKFIYN